LSPHFEGSYFTGQAPPIPFTFLPFTAVVDMRSGAALAVDEHVGDLSLEQILAAVDEAGD
jgi:hypothetical protein